MRKHWKALAAISVGMAGVIAVAVWAAENEEEQEEKVSIDKVPAVVKAAIEKEGGKVEDIAKEDANGKTIYEADVIKDGKEIELRIAEDGSLVSRKVEGDAKEDEEGDDDDDEDEKEGDDEERSEAGREAAACVRGAKAVAAAKITMAQAIEAALEQVPGGKPYMVELKLEDGKPQYEVQVSAGDKCMEVVIDGESRKLIEIEPKGGSAEKADKGPWRDSFAVDKANLGPTGRNPYFILEPGHKLTYAGGDEKLTITVLEETKVVDGVTTRVVEEREEQEGKLAEVSRNFFAIDKITNDVYYFGEEVDDYKDGKVVGHGGAWLSGVKGAQFGLLMPAKAKVGDKFYQEIAPKVAMDRAEIVSIDEELKTPAGTFKCVHVKETSPLEKGASHKWYAPGIGLVKDEGLALAESDKAR